MERQFSAEIAFNKKIYREFGYMHIKRSKSWAVILGCTIFLMAWCVLGAALGMRLRVSWLVCVGFFYLYWLFTGHICGILSYRSANKKSRGTPGHLRFTEEALVSESSFGGGTTAYAAFMDVMESENLFALYTSKVTAVIVPKAALQGGSVDDFRAFLTEKIGPVRRLKSPKRRMLLGSLLGVAFVAAMIGATLLRGYWDARLTPYGDAPYSICLPAAFEPLEDEDYHFAASADEVYVYVYSESQEELHSYGIYGLETIADYAEDHVLAYGIQDPTYETLENGALCLTYSQSYDDVTIYYCDALMQSGETFWVTEFYCIEAQRDEYAPQFLKWAATIQIAEP